MNEKDKDYDKIIGPVIKSSDTIDLYNYFNDEELYYLEEIDNETSHMYKIIGLIKFDIN